MKKPWFEVVKQDYIEELQLSCDMFCENIIPVAKKKWDREREELDKRFEDYLKRVSMCKKYATDPIKYNLPESFVVPEEYELDFWSKEWQMKAYSYHRIMGAGFSNIVMMWEQQLFDYMKYHDNGVENFYNNISKYCLKYTDFDLTNDKRINEIRNVVNSIKHGKDTNSFRALEKNNSKFLEENISAMFSEVEERYFFISISDQDIKETTDHFISFWEKLQYNGTTIHL